MYIMPTLFDDDETTQLSPDEHRRRVEQWEKAQEKFDVITRTTCSTTTVGIDIVVGASDRQPLPITPTAAKKGASLSLCLAEPDSSKSQHPLSLLRRCSPQDTGSTPKKCASGNAKEMCYSSQRHCSFLPWLVLLWGWC